MTPIELALIVGMATNPDAPKVGIEAHYSDLVVGGHIVVSEPLEAYGFVGYSPSIKLGGQWKLTPMIGAGVYYEDRPRNIWRDYGNWTLQYIGRITVSHYLVNGYRIGLYAEQITNLKGNSFRHGFNTSISGPSIGIKFGRGF